MSLMEQSGATNGHAVAPAWRDTAAIPWSSDAPRALRTHYPRPGNAVGWQRWRRHLAKRLQSARPKRLLSQLTAGKHSPLLWALPGEGQAASIADVIESLWRLDRPRSALAKRQSGASHPDGPNKSTAAKANDATMLAERLDQWFEAAAAPPSVWHALEAVAWARALPRLAEVLDEATWWRLWNALARLASDENMLSGDNHPAESVAATAIEPHSESPGASAAGGEFSAAEESWLIGELLARELPLTLGFQLPELSSAADFALAGWRGASIAYRKRARRWFSPRSFSWGHAVLVRLGHPLLDDCSSPRQASRERPAEDKAAGCRAGGAFCPSKAIRAFVDHAGEAVPARRQRDARRRRRPLGSVALRHGSATHSRLARGRGAPRSRSR